jgi:transcriptional regulator of acetoin/glycerol metabolism
VTAAELAARVAEQWAVLRVAAERQVSMLEGHPAQVAAKVVAAKVRGLATLARIDAAIAEQEAAP